MNNETLWESINYYYKDFVLFKIQNVGITISHLMVAIIAVLLSLVVSQIIRSSLRNQVFKKITIDEGLEYTILRFVHFLILFIGIYIGLNTINIPLGAILGLFAVIGVGIGFGLQNLTSNFISGIILLLERPVKVGDRLEISGVWGDVKHVNLRTTLIETPDGISVIVPNSKLLENEVVNYSYGNPKIRLQVPVGIAYGSDCQKAAEVLVQVALDNKRVLIEPKPKAWFREFGDSSLNFMLLFWIPNAVDKYDVISDINHAIDAGFRKNGIEIPFPQRDLHLRSTEGIINFRQTND